jgi:pathogenesis-related protein 1
VGALTLGLGACASSVQPDDGDEAGTGGDGGEGSDPFGTNDMSLPNGTLQDLERDDALAAHNDVRADVDLPPLEWSEPLARIAATWADGCIDADGDDQIDHNVDLNELELGENIWAGTRSRDATIAVDGWAAEEDDYDAEENTCAPGAVCGHYKQIVWRDTNEVGCARAFCEDLEYRYVVICNYRPPGNIADQRPY